MQPPSRSSGSSPREPEEPHAAFAPLGAGGPPLIGGYRVLARLGTGRLGPVYLAATQSGRRLAINSVRPEFADDSAFRTKFKQRIATAQRARGPYLATVVDGHAEGARPWVATEYAPGPALGRAVAEAGPLPVPAVRVLLGTVAEALQAIHDADMVHGTLSPSNVLLTGDGPRVVGLGAPPHEPTDSATPGTPVAADDVFALGRLALFAATGDGTSADPLDCPEELRGPIGRCLDEDPGRRPEPRALVAELEAEPPCGPDWLPPGIAASLSAYQADPPKRNAPPLPATVSRASPASPASPALPPRGAPSQAPATRPDSSAGPQRSRPRPNFAVPAEPPPTDPASFPIAPAGPGVNRGIEPVMGTYRHDLVIALGIGGGAFGLLVLVLLLVILV